MYMIHFVVVCVLTFSLQTVVEETPNFRILAPPFLCPKDEEAVIDKPDNTVITLQTDSDQEVVYIWTVRWYPLDAPTQRKTLALWQTVRKLEKLLNGVQTEPGVYVIDNKQLLSGVIYIFNVTALFPDGVSAEKSFHIDNNHGDQKLMFEGRTDMFSIVLVGGQLAYADFEYILEAQVTTCYKTNDYFFTWSVSSDENEVDVSYVKGSRLEIRPYNLTPGLSYNVLCKVFRISDGEFITENYLPFQVLRRDLNVNFNVDVLVISTDTPFRIQTNINNIDYLRNELVVTWNCTYNNETFEDIVIEDDGSLTFRSGLPDVGEYIVSISVHTLDGSQTGDSMTRILTTRQQLPIIDVSPIPRMINEGDTVNLNADLRNVFSGCGITWYFTYAECVSPTNVTNANNCIDYEHGEPISEPVHFYSLEENFLNELTDYSNETAKKSVAAVLPATKGRIRIVAACECNLISNCTTEGTVHADVNLIVNEKPAATGDILIMPETGTAMETVFRISTRALADPNKPLRYSFYCDFGFEEPLLLGSYLEYIATETMLPYADGVSLWVEVCDALQACSSGTKVFIQSMAGEARTLYTLLEDVQAHIMRCEIGMLRRLAISTIVTYVNANQSDAHKEFLTTLQNSLQHIEENCTTAYQKEYTALQYSLTKLGVSFT